MSEKAINIGWNQYEVALLIESYQKCLNGEISRKEAIANLSKRLRDRMIRLGSNISDTYRNENGISLQLSAIENCFTDGTTGIGHPSILFREMTEVYLQQREIYESVLNMANIMYPAIKESSIQHHTSQTYTSEDDKSFSVKESLTEWYINEKIKQVLKEKFPHGYRLESFMEVQRIKRFYQELHGEELNIGKDDIEENIKSCGIEHEGRVYLPEMMLSEEVQHELLDYIRKAFEDGIECIYYSVLYDKFHDRFLDYQILSSRMLRKYLQYVNTEGWRFWPDYLTERQYAEIDFQQEVINYVKAQGGIVSKDEVVKGLSQFPSKEVETAFSSVADILISCGRNQRFHIDNFVATSEELKIVEDIIDSAINCYRYISFSELLENLRLQTRNLVENNEAFTEIGIRKALEIKLGNRFKFTNNIISSYSNPVTTEDVFFNLAEKESYSIDEVMRLATDCDTLANVWIGYLMNFSVRINQTDFVEWHKVHFDIAATDDVLKKLCPEQYISLHDVTLFSALPDCGYPWNVFLLECYAAYYSKQFTLLHGRYFGKKAVGAIVKKSSGINDFSELLIQVIDKADIPLSKKSALDYLFDNGYIAQRRYDDIDDVLSKIKKNKNKK